MPPWPPVVDAREMTRFHLQRVRTQQLCTKSAEEKKIDFEWRLSREWANERERTREMRRKSVRINKRQHLVSFTEDEDMLQWLMFARQNSRFAYRCRRSFKHHSIAAYIPTHRVAAPACECDSFRLPALFFCWARNDWGFLSKLISFKLELLF